MRMEETKKPWEGIDLQDVCGMGFKASELALPGLMPSTLAILRRVARYVIQDDANGSAHSTWYRSDPMRNEYGIFDREIATELRITRNRAYVIVCTAITELENASFCEKNGRIYGVSIAMNVRADARVIEHHRITEEHDGNDHYTSAWICLSKPFEQWILKHYAKTKEIYRIRNDVNALEYVGQAINSRMRFKQHVKDSCKGCGGSRSLEYAIRKIGAEHFWYEHIDMFAKDANAAERHWINELKTLTPNGYNISTGGGDQWQSNKMLK